MKQLKFLYTRSVIYVVALAVAVISMVSLRKCQHSHAGSDTGSAETDTLDVAIEYSRAYIEVPPCCVAFAVA